MEMQRRRRWIRLAAATVLGAAATTTWATPPGTNGELAFRRYHDDARTSGALFAVQADGSTVRQITRPHAGVLDTNPDWSPNGKRLAFQRVDPNGCGQGCVTEEIYVVRRDGEQPIRLSFDPPGAGCSRNDRNAGGICRNSPVWSPDGKRIAFTCASLVGPRSDAWERICLVAANGSGFRQLTRTPPGIADGWPEWSPHGRRLAVQRAIGNRRAVFVMNADGSGAMRVTEWRLRGGQPDWSPDARRILFTSNIDGPDDVSGNLYTIRPDGTGLRQLTHARGGTVDHLSATFSPDGRWITFSRTPGAGEAGNADVFVMRADGSDVRQVTRSAKWESATDWGSS